MNFLFKYFKFELLKLKCEKFLATMKQKSTSNTERAKKVDMHFYQRVIIHYTHFFAASLPVWSFLILPPPPPLGPRPCCYFTP